jgi:hypothetical protein
MSAAQLKTSSGKSQARLSAVLASMGEKVARLGAARSMRYALKKDIIALNADQALSWATKVLNTSG